MHPMAATCSSMRPTKLPWSSHHHHAACTSSHAQPCNPHFSHSFHTAHGHPTTTMQLTYTSLTTPDHPIAHLHLSHSSRPSSHAPHDYHNITMQPTHPIAHLQPAYGHPKAHTVIPHPTTHHTPHHMLTCNSRSSNGHQMQPACSLKLLPSPRILTAHPYHHTHVTIFHTH